MNFNYQTTLKPLTVAITMTLAGHAALAQPNQLESIVVTADRQRSALRDIPASIFSVNRDVLDSVRHVHINETLVRVPGTWISRGNGQESLTAIRSPATPGTPGKSPSGLPAAKAGWM